MMDNDQWDAWTRWEFESFREEQRRISLTSKTYPRLPELRAIREYLLVQIREVNRMINHIQDA